MNSQNENLEEREIEETNIVVLDNYIPLHIPVIDISSKISYKNNNRRVKTSAFDVIYIRQIQNIRKRLKKQP